MPSASGFRVEVQRHIRGAYFRKVQSAAHLEYKGIRGIGVLPELTFDPTRQFVSPEGLDHFQTGPLDRPSVYIGGHAGGHEVDAGLTWDRVYDGAGRPTFTDLPKGTDGRDPTHRFAEMRDGGQVALLNAAGTVIAEGDMAVETARRAFLPNFAFRPFWRTTNDRGNQWHNPRPGAADNIYYYPNDRFFMVLEIAGREQVQLTIRGMDDQNALVFSQVFRQEGFGLGLPQSYKRVNSIDQFHVNGRGRRVGSEGHDALPTRTTAVGGGWAEVALLGPAAETWPLAGADGVEVRGGDVADRYEAIFRCAGWNREGAESIDIRPA